MRSMDELFQYSVTAKKINRYLLATKLASKFPRHAVIAAKMRLNIFPKVELFRTQWTLNGESKKLPKSKYNY